MNSFWLVRLGSLLCGGGIVWAAYVATRDFSVGDSALRDAAAKVLAQTGPLEISAFGVLLWLVGKWRSSVKSG
jgi:hypothetical protein